ncbi:uncharacterized protein C17orf53 homolog isoform X2 [Cynoglossus semilaevis]|uniref:Homologous recombination factor with OB-fold n=1 Tax=Cynoglossus semilaevis TaxID=244447 RepID=A0A3P8X1G0_CYNSE|nr:uncharacterized protein C17orf53 homolog isoform X2 [Cynoglossus semilaevis]
MPAMTCKVNSLFSTLDDFNNEDLLGTDWTGPSASGPSNSVATAAVSSSVLRAPSVTRREPEKKCLRQSAQGSAVPTNGTASDSGTQALSSRQLCPPRSSTSSSSLESHGTNVSTVNNTKPNVAAPQSHGSTEVLLTPCAAQDDFDDWDVDLADLDECDGQVAQQIQARSHSPPGLTSTPMLRPLNCGRTQAPPHQTTVGASKHNVPQTLSAAHLGSPVLRPRFPSAPVQSPNVFSGLTAASPAANPASRSFVRPQQPQRQWSTPGPKPPVGFESVPPSSFSPSVNSSILSPHPLHTPVLTNRLVQLVSASHKLPKKRPNSEVQKRRTRRFPGPAGLLPVQPEAQTLDPVVVSVPFTPAHGPVARLPSQVSSSQMEDDDFSGAAWALMMKEMGLDERNPTCFLHSYSVVMVLRKAALKQLVNNKVPNMAVVLKTINYTHTDAKVVFKDPTGEMQGTVHRRLLEGRRDDLKAGVVLLLKQVGVFSPSHRNHYLNVTPNNLLRIYTADGASVSSTQLPPLVLEPVLQSPAPSRNICPEPVSQMQLVFDDEDEEGREGEKCSEGGCDPQTAVAVGVTSGCGREQPDGSAVLQDPDWDADDDLDELLGEVPEDPC